jgi:hypothetical protein
MEENNSTSSSDPTAHVVGVKSWLAYTGVALQAVLLFGGALPLALHFAGEIAGAVVLVVSALIVGYQFLLLRSVQLYYDEVGVWVHQGILPWSKGLSGVKWRDMDEAIFEQGFWSWITRSYTVRITHRFTKDSEIRLTNIGGGKDAVGTLNGLHQRRIRDGSVD